jgi:hypothetical protein
VKTLCRFAGSIFSAAVFFAGASALAQTNRPIPPENDAPSHKIFGPVSEQVLTNTIELGFVPVNGAKSGSDQPISLAANFAREQFDPGDFHYMAGDGLYCVDMKLIKLVPNDWSNLEANQLASALAATRSDANHPNFQPHSSGAAKYGFQVYHSSVKLPISDPNAPAVYGFQTHHGVMGILRITSPTSDKPGVRIRYKLLENGAESR